MFGRKLAFAKKTNFSFCGIGKHNDVPDSQFDPKELALGIKTELEHTNDPGIAKNIARDHLVEDAHYYTKLLKAGL
jgi:hypothetical protein